MKKINCFLLTIPYSGYWQIILVLEDKELHYLPAYEFPRGFMDLTFIMIKLRDEIKSRYFEIPKGFTTTEINERLGSVKGGYEVSF